jgi:hypothetical protein
VKRASEHEAEESGLSEAIARKGLVNTQHIGKDFVCAVVICELWRLVMVLQVLVVPSHVYK